MAGSGSRGRGTRAPSDSITRKLFALIARGHQMLGDLGAALRTCAEGLSYNPEDAELWFRQAVVHRHRGDPAKAEACWRRIVGLRPPEEFCNVDIRIYGHVTWRNLAALAAERGDHAEAERLWAEVLVECPGDREALGALERCRAALRMLAPQQLRPPGPQALRPTGQPPQGQGPVPGRPGRGGRRPAAR